MMERQAYLDNIRLLAEENRALLDEIHRLRSDMKYVESVARKELNLVKENEVIYRFEEGGDKSDDDVLIPSKGKGSEP